MTGSCFTVFRAIKFSNNKTQEFLELFFFLGGGGEQDQSFGSALIAKLPVNARVSY